MLNFFYCNMPFFVFGGAFAAYMAIQYFFTGFASWQVSLIVSAVIVLGVIYSIMQIPESCG